MNSNVKIAITLVDRASAKAKAVLTSLNKLNTTFRTSVLIEGKDKLTPVLDKIHKNIGKKKAVINVTTDEGFIDKANKSLQKLNKNLDFSDKTERLVKDLQAAAVLIDSMLAGVVALGVALAVASSVSMAKYLKQSLELNKVFEINVIQLQTVLGSLAAAKREMKEILEYAKETPFGLEDVTKSVVKLRSYFMDPKQWLDVVGDMAGAFGRPAEDAVEAVAAAAQGQFRRLLAYGVRLLHQDFKEGGKHAGKTFAEAAYEEISIRFAGGMQLQSRTLEGLMANISDIKEHALQQLGEPVFAALKESIEKIFYALNTDEVNNKIQEFISDFATAFTKIYNAISPIVEYLKTHVLPIIIRFLKTTKSLATAIVEAFANPVVTNVIKTLAIELLRVVDGLVQLIGVLKPLIQVYVVLRSMSLVMGVLSTGLGKAAASMVALGKASSLTEANVAILSKRVALVAAVIATMFFMSKRNTLNENINEIGDSLESMGKNIRKEDLGKYFNDLGKETNYSSEKISTAANSAKEFGNVGKVVLEAAARAARDMGKDLVVATDIIGNISEKMISFGMSAEEAASKVNETADALAYINKNSERLGVTQDDVLAVLNKYPELLSSVKHGWEDIIGVMELYSKSSDNARKDLYLFAEVIDLLKSPDAEMFKQLDSSVWIGRTTADLQNYGFLVEEATGKTSEFFKEAAESGKNMQQLLDNYSKSLIKNTELTGSFGKKSSYTIADIQKAYKLMDRQVNDLTKSIEFWNIEVEYQNDLLEELQPKLKSTTEALTAANAEVKKFTEMQPTGTRAYQESIADLSDEINRLDLKKLYFDLDLLNARFDRQEKTIKSMTYQMNQMRTSLNPLKTELETVKTKFDEVSKSIQQAQGDLDKFTNPKLKGMDEFNDKIHEVEMEITKLQRQRIDASSKVSVFDRLGLTGTEAYKAASTELSALDKLIDQKNEQLDRLRLDRSIAYDDQLYQLGKIKDREKEITFEEAVAGATEAVQVLERLEPQLDTLAKEQDRLQEIVDLRQAEIDKMNQVIDARQEELDIQKSSLTDAQAELQVQIDRLKILQQITTLSRDISLASFTRQRESILNPFEEGSPTAILGGLSGAIEEATVLSEIESDLNRQISIATDAKSVGEKQLSTLTALQTDLSQQMKSILKYLPSFIEGINIENLATTNKSTLEDVFSGPMATIISLLGGDSVLPGIEKAGESQKGRGIIGDLTNWMQSSVAGNIVGGALTLAGTALAGKGLKKLSTKILPKDVPPGMSAEMKAFLNVEKATAKGPQIKMPGEGWAGLQTQKAGKGGVWLDLFAKDAQKVPSKSVDEGLAKLFNKDVVEEVTKATEKAGKTAKTPTGARGVLTKFFSALPGVTPAKEAMQAAGELVAGSKNPLTSFRTLLYKTGQTGGWLQTAMKASPEEFAKRAGRVGTGKLTAKKVFPKVTEILGGGKKASITATPKLSGGKGGKAGILGVLAMGGLGGLLGGEEGFDTGGAIEAAAYGGTYTGLSKLGTAGAARVGTKIGSKGLSRLIPGLGWAALAGDVLRIGEHFAGGKGTFGEVISDTVSTAGEKWNEFVKDVNVPLFGDLQIKNVEKLGDAAGGVVGGVTGTFTDLSRGLDNAVGSLVGIGKGIFTGDWSDLKTHSAELATNLKDMGQNATRAVGNIPLLIAESGEAIFDKIKGPFEKGYGWIRDNFKPVAVLDEKVLSPLKNWFSTKYAGIKDWLSDPWNKTSEWLSGDDGPKSWPEKIVGFVKGIPEWFSGDKWNSVKDTVKQPFETAWGWLSGESGPSSWFSSISGWFQNIINWISSTWQEVSGRITEPFSRAWNWLISEEGPRSWWNKITGWFQNIIGWFSGTLWPSLKEKITQPFSDAWGWIVENVSSWPNKIADFFKSIPTKIGEAAVSIYNAGRDLVNNLLNGVRDTWSSVREAPGVKQIFDAIDYMRGYDRTAAAYTGSGISGFASGGVVNVPPGKEMLARLHGHEAIVPLQNGAIPVEFKKSSQGGGTTVITNHNTYSQGAFNFVVRDDGDIEEIKKILLKIMEGQSTHQDRAHTYAAGY